MPYTCVTGCFSPPSVELCWAPYVLGVFFGGTKKKTGGNPSRGWPMSPAHQGGHWSRVKAMLITQLLSEQRFGGWPPAIQSGAFCRGEVLKSTNKNFTMEPWWKRKEKRALIEEKHVKYKKTQERNIPNFWPPKKKGNYMVYDCFIGRCPTTLNWSLYKRETQEEFLACYNFESAWAKPAGHAGLPGEFFSSENCPFSRAKVLLENSIQFVGASTRCL